MATRIPTHVRQRQQLEPPSVRLLIEAGHPVKAMVVSMFWRMPWRTMAVSAAAIATGTHIVFPSWP